VEKDLIPAVYRLEMLEELDRAAAAAGKIVNAHLKIDTGMGRLGVRFEELPAFAEKLESFKNVWIDGVMTHFASADQAGQDEFTRSRRRASKQRLISWKVMVFAHGLVIWQIQPELFLIRLRGGI